MDWWYNSSNTFKMWDVSHFLTLVVIFLLLASFYLFRNKLVHYRNTIRLTVGIMLIFSRISLDIWYITTGEWSPSQSLPLELCSIASLVCAIMLLTKSRFLLEIFYFIAIGGALQAILTPALDFGMPQYRYMQFFIDHTMLILAPFLLIWFYHYSLSWMSVLKSFISINIIAAIVFVINYAIDANYMFLIHKPLTASLLDILGPYPYYLLSLEGIVLGTFIILYQVIYKLLR